MFRFTIRDVLWLTVVVAICVSWNLTHLAQSKQWWAFHDRKYRDWEKRYNDLYEKHLDETKQMQGTIQDLMQEKWQLELKNEEHRLPSP